MNPVETGVLNVKMYVETLLMMFRNKVGGLRQYTNNKGIIVGNVCRWPLVDTNALATLVNSGAPSVSNPVYADTVEATIKQYEHVAKLDSFILNSTNSAAGLRAAAAIQTVTAVENRFSKDILDELTNYDDTNMELGDGTAAFTVDTFTDLDLMARINNWPDSGRMLLLPPSAENTLKKDEKFYQVWSAYQGRNLANPGLPVGSEDSTQIQFVPYRGWMVGFMGQVGGDNVVGLPATYSTTIDTGYAWIKDRVGFVMNQAVQSVIWQENNIQGSPMLFKSIGSCGAKILDEKGVIGILMSTVTL